MATAVAGPEELIAGGTRPPGDVPDEIFGAALAIFLSPRRLDMRALALELGIGRATLYRRAGNRDNLLGAVVWYLTRRALAPAIDAAAGLEGRERVVAIVDRFMRFVHVQPALHRFLDEEPEAALRILTSKNGPVEGGIVEALERLLADEEARGALRLTIDRSTLAYVIVRIGESFLYADVIADNEPDVALAVDVIERLLRAS
ncbi:MAG: QsdR family transcriptional regulator [Thermoleophilaceae bacterium]